MAHRISLYDGSGWVSDDEEDIVQNRDELADNHSQINAIQDSSTLDSSTLASPRSLRRSNAVRIASTSKRDNNNTTSTPTIAMASSANTTTNETITTAEAATRREISPIRRIPGHLDLIAVAAMQPHYGIAAVAAADVPLTPKTPRKSSFVAPALGNSPEKKRVKFRRFLHRINRGLEKAIRPFRLKSKKQKAAEAELEQIRKTKEAEYEKLQSERLAADKNIAATTENVKPDTAKPVVNNPLPAAPVTDKQLPEVPLDDSFEENMFPQDMIQQVAEHRQYSQSSFEAVALAGVERNVYTMATDVPVLPKSSGGADIVTLEADSAIKNAVLQTDNAQRNSVDDTLTAEAEVINDTLTPEAEVINETPAVETENETDCTFETPVAQANSRKEPLVPYPNSSQETLSPQVPHPVEANLPEAAVLALAQAPESTEVASSSTAPRSILRKVSAATDASNQDGPSSPADDNSNTPNVQTRSRKVSFAPLPTRNDGAAAPGSGYMPPIRRFSAEEKAIRKFQAETYGFFADPESSSEEDELDKVGKIKMVDEGDEGDKGDDDTTRVEN